MIIRNLFILLVLLFCITFSSSAQRGLKIINPILTTNQELILNALDSTLFIVKQEYTIKTNNLDKNIEFGKDGNPYFGKHYSLGILSDGDLYVNKGILNPWAFDSNYFKYKHVDTLQPSLSKAYLRNIKSNQFKDIPPSIGYSDSANAKLPVCMFTDINFPKGIRKKNHDNSVEGWIVLVYTENPISSNDTSTHFKYAIYKTTLKFENNQAKLDNIPVTSNLIGGVFVTLKYSTGQIMFYASGILFKKMNTYFLSRMPEKIITQKDDLQIIDKNSNDKKEKKKKKNK